MKLKRSEIYSSKGRIKPSFFNAEELPQIQKERLNERLSNILLNVKNGEQTNEDVK